jgi:UDP-N-acetylglucosamine 2-epimerase (non-hydrolysing)
MKAASIIGTRPEIIKIAPLLPGLDLCYDHKLIHTGQHSDYYMRELFFKQLNLRDPDYTLECGEIDSSKRIGCMITEVDEALKLEKPDVCIVLGDTNSTLAGSLAASKRHIPLIHVEAGLRSFDKNMPEEVNRIIVDHISDVLLAPSPLASRNLMREGVTRNVFTTGNTAVDCCLKHLPQIREDRTAESLGLNVNEYVVVTVHRESNTREENIQNIFKALRRLQDIPMVFPAHPRTKQSLIEYGIWEALSQDNLKIINPLGYIEFLNLMLNAKFVLTDSGGVQEEAVTLKVPCLTLRENTERWETVKIGANRLIGLNPDRVVSEVRKAWNDDEWKKKLNALENPYGNGDASNKIISIIKHYFPVSKITAI